MGAFDDIGTMVIPNPDDPQASEAFRKKWRWEPHELITIKDTVTVADQEYVTNLYGKANKKGQIEAQMGAGRFAILDRMIIGWTFLYKGQPVPLTPANIRRLPANYSNPILEAIDELARAMTEEEQEDFLDGANGHIVDGSNSMSLFPMRS